MCWHSYHRYLFDWVISRVIRAARPGGKAASTFAACLVLIRQRISRAVLSVRLSIIDTTLFASIELYSLTRLLSLFSASRPDRWVDFPSDRGCSDFFPARTISDLTSFLGAVFCPTSAAVESVGDVAVLEASGDTRGFGGWFSWIAAELPASASLETDLSRFKRIRRSLGVAVLVITETSIRRARKETTEPTVNTRPFLTFITIPLDMSSRYF